MDTGVQCDNASVLAVEREPNEAILLFAYRCLFLDLSLAGGVLCQCQ